MEVDPAELQRLHDIELAHAGCERIRQQDVLALIQQRDDAILRADKWLRWSAEDLAAILSDTTMRRMVVEAHSMGSEVDIANLLNGLNEITHGLTLALRGKLMDKAEQAAR